MPPFASSRRLSIFRQSANLGVRSCMELMAIDTATYFFTKVRLRKFFVALLKLYSGRRDSFNKSDLTTF
jgi:hypothetical protein